MEKVDLIIAAEKKYKATKEQDDLDDMIELVQKYLGKPGILRENYQKKFMKFAVEHEQDENKNPLLKLVKQADQKLKEVITDSENHVIIFLEDHAATQDRINAILQQQVVLAPIVAKPVSVRSEKSEAPVVVKAVAVTIESVQQFIQKLPYEHLEKLNKKIKTSDMQVKNILDLVETAKSSNEGSLSESLQNRLITAQTDLDENVQELTSARNKFTQQIINIVKSPESRESKQAMVIVSNFRALLTKDFKQSCEIIKRFETQTIDNLQNKLQEFLTPQLNVESQLKDLISQLSVLISYAENTRRS